VFSFLRPNNTYEGSWDAWQDEMESITANTPYMSLPGNHECTCTEVTPFLCPSNQQNFTAYRHRFRMPSEESGGVENMWYSYDYGLVHFIQIDTETDYPDAPMGAGTLYNGRKQIGAWLSETHPGCNDSTQCAYPLACHRSLVCVIRQVVHSVIS
jgi:hypothetical protein